MIEEVVLKYLNAELSAPVYMEMPEEPVERFVLIEKTGSSIEDHIQNATIAIQSYAQSMQRAASLNEEVKEAMKKIIVLDAVFKSKLNSDYNFTDITMEKYRYQAVYDLVY